MIDKNGKIFGRLSIIDLFAVIIIVCVVVGTYYKFSSPSTAITSGQKDIVYTLKINGVREFTYDYYQMGYECYDKKTNEHIGKIVGIRKEPYRERIVLLDGQLAYAEKPNVIDVYLDIETKGIETEVAFFANGTYELKSGSEINLKTKFVDVITTVDNVYAK